MRKRLDRFYSDPGERFEQQYTGVKLADGTISLVESEVVDLQEYINSFKDSVSIEHIMSMCIAGDTSALSKAQGVYIDTTAMPKTFRDVLDIVIKGKSQFDGLPIDIKNKFGNDFMAWFEDAGTEDWYKRMNLIKETTPDVKESDSNAES